VYRGRLGLGLGPGWGRLRRDSPVVLYVEEGEGLEGGARRDPLPGACRAHPGPGQGQGQGSRSRGRGRGKRG